MTKVERCCDICWAVERRWVGDQKMEKARCVVRDRASERDGETEGERGQIR